MLFPAVAAVIDDAITASHGWSSTIPTGMASMLVIVSLIILELLSLVPLVQVSCLRGVSIAAGTSVFSMHYETTAGWMA